MKGVLDFHTSKLVYVLQINPYTLRSALANAEKHYVSRLFPKQRCDLET
jgi:hypothetical protein